MKFIGIAIALAFCVGCASGPKATSHIYSPNSGEAQTNLDPATIPALTRHAIVKEAIIGFGSKASEVLGSYCSYGHSKKDLNDALLNSQFGGEGVVFDSGLSVNAAQSPDANGVTAIVDPVTGLGGYVCNRYLE